MFASVNLLKIKTDDVETQRKGALLQGLVVALIGLSVIRAIIEIFQPAEITLQAAISQSITSVLFGLLCLWIIRSGNIRLASHLFFSVLNTIFFVLLVTTSRNLFFPYLMLISVVAIATLDSVRASVLYSVITLTSVISFFLLTNALALLAAIEFAVTCLRASW